MSVFGWSYPAGCSGPPDQDGPEVCPVCGGENYDEEADASVYPDDPAFCSAACAEMYATAARKEAEAEAAALLAETEEMPSGGPCP